MDTPGAREVFGRFRLEAVQTSYGIQKGQQRAGELIVSKVSARHGVGPSGPTMTKAMPGFRKSWQLRNSHRIPSRPS